MSKLNQIENAIRELEGGKFQKLCDSLISVKEKVQITSTGSHDGTDKTIKGTPDSYYTNNNGNFVFIEYSTQKKGLLKKISDDIGKCFDVNMTNIPIENIDKIIYCHIDKLKPEEKNIIMNLCKDNNCDFHNYDISSLSFDLAYSFPQIAYDILNISIDTNQILLKDKFIQESSRIITLKNKFYHRENECSEIISALDTDDIVIITGEAGTGKTRIAIECLTIFTNKYPEYYCYYIKNRSVPLYKDFLSLYNSHDKIILLLDDANKLDFLNMFFGFINFKPNKLKLVLTVRLYAKYNVIKSIGDIKFINIKIEKFNKAQINSIVSDRSIGNLNQLAIDRISDISRGNARLAIMAAKVAIEENNISSLNNSIEIYDSFFRINNELFSDNLNGKNLKKTLCIVSYFNHIYNEDPPQNVYQIFGITESDFWESIEQLNRYEMVDLYENQLCKISDQILGNYIFYKVVFDEKLINFNVFLINYFSEKFVERMQESLSSVVNIFDYKKIKSTIKQPIINQWDMLLESNNQKLLFLYADTFYFVIPSKALLYINKMIGSYDYEAKESKIETNYLGDFVRVFSLLNKFSRIENTYVRISIQIACNYYLKYNTNDKYFIDYIKNSFNYNRMIIPYTLNSQKILFSTLFAEAQKNILLTDIIVQIIPYFLKMEHENIYSEGLSVNFSHFILHFSKPIQELHEDLLNNLKTIHPNKYINFLEKYIENMRSFHVKDIKEIQKALKYDSNYISKYIGINFSFDNLVHSIIVFRYKELLDEYSISYKEFETTILSANTDVFKVFSTIKKDRFTEKLLRKNGKTYEEINQIHNNKIISSISNYDLTDFKLLLDNIENEIVRESSQQVYIIRSSFEIIMGYLITKKNLFYQVLNYIMIKGNKCGLMLHSIPSVFINQHPEDHSEFYKLIIQNQYSNKDYWIYNFFSELPEHFITEYYYNEFETYLRQIQINWNIFFECLIKFEHIKKGAFIKFIKILYNNREENNINFSEIFNSDSSFREKVLPLFNNDTILLENLYLYSIKKDENEDYDCFFIQYFLSKNSQFIIEYLKVIYSIDQISYGLLHNPNFSFLWDFEDFEGIITKAIYFILENESYFWDNNYINVFFETKELNDLEIEKIKAKQMNFFNSFIDLEHENYKAMRLIFIPIKRFYWNQMTELALFFIQKENKIEALQAISLDYVFLSCSDSFIPLYNEILLFWENLLSRLDSIEYIEVQEYVNKKIEYWENRISDEQKQQFVGFF